MNRRHAHRFASPALTGGDDRPDTPCTRDVAARLAIKAATGDYPPSPFDVLMDKTQGPEFKPAVEAARELCNSCPVKDACLNANRDEQWVKAVRGRDLRTAPTKRPTCGTPQGANRHLKAGERSCKACLKADAERMRARKAELRNRRAA